MEKANPLIETEDDNSEPLTGGGALSGTVPSERRASERSAPFSRASTTQLSAGISQRPGASGTRLSVESSAGWSAGEARRNAEPRPVKSVESGVFSGLSGQVTGEQLVDSLQSALSAASRGEAGLGSLHRSVRDASRALTSLRHSHESLGEELRVMYRGLNEVMSEKAAIERYAALLTQERDAALDAAEEARREAKRERDFLLREQDRFIQLLLEEHEAELQQLRRALSGRSSAPPPVVIPAAASSGVASSAAASSALPPPLPPSSVSAPAIVVQTEPTTGFRIGVEAKPAERGDTAEGPEENVESADETEATLRAIDAPRALEERRAVVPMPRPDLDETPTFSSRAAASGNGASPLARLQLAPSQPPAPGELEDEPAMTERGIGERNSVLDRSLAERHLLDTLRSEVPAADADGRAGTYPPPPALLDLDSLAAEVEGNSERPPPIRRIGSRGQGAVEPKLHLKPAKVPAQLLDTLLSRTDGEETEEKS